MKNPKECVCIQQNQTFFVLNELEAPEYKDGSEPLTFHHETFSRFKFVIINQEKKVTTANVGVRVIPGITRKIQNLYLKEILQQGKSKGEVSKSPAYTTVITMGNLKGKTPAALMLEDAQRNREVLIKQKMWLESHLNKYPKNEGQIRAIEDALRLYDEGKLNQEDMECGYCTETIYSSGMRPLTRRTRKDGKSFVYEIAIRWNGGAEKPVEIEIRNYYAPVVRQETGLLNVMAKEKVDEIKNVVFLTIDQWLWVEHMMNSNIRTFEALYAAKHYKMAMEEERKNREMFKGSDPAAS